MWCELFTFNQVDKVDFISLRKRLRSTQRIITNTTCQRLQTAVAIWFHITTRSRSSSLTQDWLKTNCTDFIAFDEWPPNSSDLNPLDYHVWGAMLEAYHKLQPKSKTIPEMKIALQQVWTDLPQTPMNKAVNDFRKRFQACISAGGGHFEHVL